jgi:TolA-binding protein
VNGATATGTGANGATASGTANGTTASGATVSGTDANGASANGTGANDATASGATASGTGASGAVANGATANGAPPGTDTKHAAIEHYFQAGYALLRAGKADEAAKELAAAADVDPDDTLAVDARYFEGVALVKAHRPAEAERVLVAFLDRAKTSLRRGRASVMLARLLADRGDSKSARAWFESAAKDGDPEVARSARAGLDALDRPAPP